MSTKHPIRLLGIAGLAVSLAFAVAPQKKESAKEPKKTAAGDPKKGAELFKANCRVCHLPDKNDKLVGPGLKGVLSRGKMQSGDPINDETLRNRIMNGFGAMTPFQDRLGKKEISDVIAYLHTL